jgi:hypothetical protein
VKILRDRTRDPRESVPWALVVAAAFFAPYVYIFAASGEMEPIAYVGVLLWMAVFGALALHRIRKQVRAEDVTGSDEADLQRGTGSH